jgi:NAD(P)-dependent dehydrogenase (short-subunit alcohol dehydrogenase family)
MKIEGQAALVTGGASGLGEATARELARLGAKVAVLDRNAALAEKVAADIGGVACVCDITDTDSVNAALDKAEAAHGPARILMNVAGIGSARRIVGKDGNPAPLEDFVRVVNINLVGGYNMARLFAARCAKLAALDNGEKGVMLFTASVAAFDGQVGQQAYSASKGGLVGMTLPMARDLAQHAIRVCTVAPACSPRRCCWSCPRPCSFAGRVHSVSAAPGQAFGVCRAGLPRRHQRPPQRRSDPLDGALRMAPR